MAKNEMKNIGVVVVIMIMLCFSEAKLTCPAQCGISCILANLAYLICFAICVAKCPRMSNEATQCMSHCGVNKSINIKIGILKLFYLCFIFQLICLFIFLML